VNEAMKSINTFDSGLFLPSRPICEPLERLSLCNPTSCCWLR